MELWMNVLGISDGYLHANKMQQSIIWVWRGQWDPKDQKDLEHHQVVRDLGVSLVSLLRWNKEECKHNKLFGLAQERLQGKNSLPCFAITLNNYIALLSQHTSCLFNSSAQIDPKNTPSTFPPPITSTLIQTAVMLSGGLAIVFSLLVLFWSLLCCDLF